MNAKTDLDEYLVTEFSRAFVALPAEAIQAAFRGWRDVSPFFPAISEIRELASLWVRRHAAEREEAEQTQRRQEENAARERGELIEWPDVLKKFAAVVDKAAAEKLVPGKAMPDPPKEIVITQEQRDNLQEQLKWVRAKYGEHA